MNILPVVTNGSDISVIIRANNIIKDSNEDKPVTKDDIAILMPQISNIKALDLFVSVFKYSIRNNDIELATYILDQYHDIASNITALGLLDKYTKTIPALINYMSNMYMISQSNKTKLIDKLDTLEIYLSGLKLKFADVDDELYLTDADLRLAALLDSMMEIITECNINQTMNESVKDTIRKTGDAIAKKAVMFSVKDREISDRINEKFNRFMKEYRDNKKTASYETIVKQSLDLSRLIKQVISSSIVALLIPGSTAIKLIGGALTLLVQFTRNKKTDNKHKGVILNDLKFELRLVQEKIKDAESKGDNKSKYKLMRIENQLARAIDRINYGLSAKDY